ncbi:hypothetical protein ACFQ60_10545 [Streptomyces zhihengii]
MDPRRRRRLGRGTRRPRRQAHRPAVLRVPARTVLAAVGPRAGDAGASGQLDTGHAVLTAAVPLADDGGLVLTGGLSLSAQPWLDDHRVLGTAILPGTGFVELALRAAREAGCATIGELTLHAPSPSHRPAESASRSASAAPTRPASARCRSTPSPKRATEAGSTTPPACSHPTPGPHTST